MDDVRFVDVSYAQPIWGLIPLAACLALFVFIIRHEMAARKADRHLKLSTLVWTLPHLALLGGTTVCYAYGNGSPGIVALALMSVVCVLSGRLTLHRDDRFPPLPLLLIAISVLGVLALECCCNAKLHTIGPQFWAVELALVASSLCGLWFLCGRRGVGPALGLVALTTIGIVQHYVLEFRGTAILPSDIFALGTALSVGGGYTYEISSGMLFGFAALSAGLGCCSLLWRGAKQHSYLRDFVCGLASVGVICALVFIPNYAAVLGAQLDYWWSKDWYERQGFLPSFIYAWQDLDIRTPNGYSEKTAQEAQAALATRYLEHTGMSEGRSAREAQFTSQRPNIVIIQNETFCDLSNFDGLRNGYTGPAFWHEGIPEALARGDLAVSVFGGGTCNTEFEFLTNGSLAFIGTAKYPFAMYDLSGVPSIPKQLNEQGYRTIGMHPNLASNWNRDRAYEQLGFNEFLVDEDFEGAEEFHTHTSDWATYDRTLELIRTTDEPVFVFDVPMQNHSGYDTGSIPEELLRNYRIDGLSADYTFQLNEFLACIDESDRALERLMQALKETSEPTIVVMYGDHHPWFSQAVNDLLFTDEDELVHSERIHNTSYVMWANYDVAGGIDAQLDGGSTSADLLGAMTLDAVGAPLSEYQQALLGSRLTTQAINAYGYLGTDGVWHRLDDTLHELSLAEYLNFGSKL